MYTHDQYFLIIGTIKNANVSPFRKMTGRAPEEVMFQFFGAGLFKTKDIAALWIDTGQHMLDSAVPARSIMP